MYLTRLVYASKISDDFNNDDIHKIIRKAKNNNSELNITGYLCFNHNYFLQCLEGGRTSVNQIYHKIVKDPRHEDLTIIDYSEINQRIFHDWAMGLYIDSMDNRSLNLQFSKSDSFNPFELSGEGAILLLKHLANQKSLKENE